MPLRLYTTVLLCFSLIACGGAGESEDDSADVSQDGSTDATDSDATDDAVEDTNSDAAPDADDDADDNGREDAETDADANVDDAETDIDEQDATTDTAGDVADDAADDASDVDEDTSAGCVQVSISGEWQIERDDDVSIGYKARVTPPVAGGFLELTLLFERYSIEPDVGVFDLSVGQDANYGSCAHCVVMRSLANLNVYYAAEGELEALDDPYDRSYAARVRGLRLVESTVDRETRASTPVEGGGCVEIADFELDVAFAADGWTCEPAAYNDDEVCNCECGAWDPDCNVVTECPPFDPGCELQEELPVAGCDIGLSCEFDPSTFAGACTEGCDWGARQGCAEGICIYDFGTGEGSLCVSDEDRLSDVSFGALCTVNAFQQFCAFVDGFATGYCGPANVCRPVCASNDECNVAGETCRFFLFEGEGLGYCGPEPEDG